MGKGSGGLAIADFYSDRCDTPASTAPSEHPQSDTSSAAVDSFARGDAHSAYDSAGVDRSLIRWMLSLTLSERLRHVQGTIDLVRNVRRAPNGDR